MEDKPIVGQGHPLDPDRHKVLSADDEKRVDEKGFSVVDGELWSECGSGLYLCVGVHTRPLKANVAIIGHSEINLGLGSDNYLLSTGVSNGKPTFDHDIVGACLELPNDLGSDAKKRQYVAEWLIATVMESLEDQKIPLVKDSTFAINLVECVAHAADIAIVAAKL